MQTGGRLGIAAWFAAIVALAGDQAQFGQAWTRNMVSSERRLPETFDPASGAGIRWSVPVGTESHGTPVIAGGRVYLGTNNEEPRDPRREGDRGVLMCFDERDGSLLWQLAVPKREEDPYLDWPKSGISSTPTVEGDRVYLVDNRGVVLCLDARGLANGNDGPFREEAAYFTPRGTNAPAETVPLGPLDADILWTLDLTQELGIWSHDAAHSSILIHGDHLYLNSGTGVDNTHKVIRTPNAPSLAVLRKSDGQVLATDGLGIAPRIFHCTWSAPSLARVDGRDRILFAGGDGVVYGFDPLPASFVLDPAKPATLTKVWQFDFDAAAPKAEVHRYNGNRAVSPSNIYGMPVVHEGRLYVAGGGDWFWGKHEAWLKCLDPEGTGDATDRALRWSYPVNRHTMSTPAVHDGLAYVADSMRVVHCVDLQTGRALWTHELGGEIWASALVADGKVYLGTRRGDFWIFAAGREKKVLASVALNAPISATAVAANGTLYVATMNRLYAIGGSTDTGAP
ncbi:MAG: PQQ-binding-like beta-propeller repeat protein [Verrucomicrobiae bacterium]|nr:PQQ-binding-like beta-propeller repeat protein [Verrucomicrobiae bacterium]